MKKFVKLSIASLFVASLGLVSTVSLAQNSNPPKKGGSIQRPAPTAEECAAHKIKMAAAHRESGGISGLKPLPGCSAR